MKLSAVIITRNAERTLERSLRSLAWVDEIVIVDSGSEDATERIARRHGARFLVRDWPGYGPQKRRAVAAAEGEWILSLDADEAVSSELAASIRRAIDDPGENVGFKMVLYTEFLGVWLGNRGWWRDWKLRLFRRDRGGFSDKKIHEGVSVRGPVGTLEGPVYHYAWRDIAHRMEKDNAYTTLAAARDFRRGRRSGVVRPYVRAAGWFVREYFFRARILHGAAGLLHSGLCGAYAYQRAAKLYELTVRDRRTGRADSPRSDADASPGSNADASPRSDADAAPGPDGDRPASEG